MHLVPAAAVRLMKRRVLSRPGVRPLLYHGTPVRLDPVTILQAKTQESVIHLSLVFIGFSII